MVLESCADVEAFYIRVIKLLRESLAIGENGTSLVLQDSDETEKTLSLFEEQLENLGW